MKTISVTVLTDNTDSAGLPGEHGLSVFIEADSDSVLWDTGQSGLFAKNAGTLGISFPETKHIALSHGHYDHTGGLETAFGLLTAPVLHAHPGVFIKRYSRSSEGTPVQIGIPFDRETVENGCSKLSLTIGPSELLPGVFTTGQIPRITDFEDTGGKFYLDTELTKADPLDDDQSLVIDTGRGLVLVAGCCHSGIINTLRYVKEQWNNDRFLLVMGGLHLVNADEARLDATVRELKRFDIGQFAPGHCTGSNATERFMKAFPEITTPIHTGWRWRYNS